MKKYEHLREKARELRRKGATLSAIYEQLSLNKSTVYSWVRDIPISRTIRQSDQLRRATQAACQRHAEQRRQWYEEARQEAAEFLNDPIMRDFVVLYAAEGYRRDKNQVSICNSNPGIVRAANKCIKRLSSNPSIEYRLQCHRDNDEDDLKQYWAECLSIDAKDIKLARKSNAGEMSGRKWRSEYGVLALRVGDTRLRCKIQAWMDYLQHTWLQN
jgi:hypothetical protein